MQMPEKQKQIQKICSGFEVIAFELGSLNTCFY